MNYEKKYKEALERMKSWAKGEHPECFCEAQKTAEFIFPELKESEDERIRKRLICGMNALKEQKKETFATIPIDDAIAWLEKQEEKVTNINGEDYSIDGLYHAIRILERTIGRVTGYQSDDGILSHEAAIDAVKELYKKQGGQEHFYDFNANDWYVSKVDGKIHDMTYNPTDKVEPKFKVGDWISGYYTSYKVMAIHSKGYMVEDTDGNKINILFENEKFYHLFTIADAKAGDVLVYETDEVEWIFIYREIVPAASEVPHDLLRYYFLLEGNYFNWNGVSAMITDNYKLYLKPATKEQQDTLFSKMKEAGYEWDSEKKELKKIEVKTLNADKVIEWLKNTIKETEERFGYNDIYKETRLTLPYDSIEDFINDFKEKFGLC